MMIEWIVIAIVREFFFILSAPSTVKILLDFVIN